MATLEQTHQTIQDSLSVACSAATSAEHRFRNLFESISKRSIAGFREHDTSEAVASGLVPFDATPEELASLRNSYTEWQSFKLLWDEKLDEKAFWEQHSRSMTWDDRNQRKLRDLKQDLWTKIYKLVFYPVVFVAAVVILAKAI